MNLNKKPAKNGIVKGTHMATLKRTKPQRGDQPTLFGGAEPVVITGEPVVFTAKNESRTDAASTVAKGERSSKKPSSDLLGLNNKITSKSDDELDGRTDGRLDDRSGGESGGRSGGGTSVAGAVGQKDSDPLSPIDTPRFYRSVQPDSRSVQPDNHRPFVHVHRKKHANEVIRLEPDTPGYTIPAWRAYRAAYVTKTLLVVVADCDAFDVPDRILVRFEGEEYPAPTRECWRLTVNLFDTIVEKCVAKEKAWEAGEMAEADYRMLRTRFAVVASVFDGLPKAIEMKGDDA